jgi:hypothetical protein
MESLRGSGVKLAAVCHWSAGYAECKAGTRYSSPFAAMILPAPTHAFHIERHETMTNYKLPPASAYADRTGADRWEDYQRIKEGKPPLLARDITEADSTPEPAPVPELPPLHELRISDPDAYAEIARQFGDYVFRGHDSRAGGGKSPFNRNWD